MDECSKGTLELSRGGGIIRDKECKWLSGFTYNNRYMQCYIS